MSKSGTIIAKTSPTSWLDFTLLPESLRSFFSEPSLNDDQSNTLPQQDQPSVRHCPTDKRLSIDQLCLRECQNTTKNLHPLAALLVHQRTKRNVDNITSLWLRLCDFLLSISLSLCDDDDDDQSFDLSSDDPQRLFLGERRRKRVLILIRSSPHLR